MPKPEEEAAHAAARAARLPFGRKLGYSAGQLVELIVASTLNIFVLYYATAVCGLSGGLAGLALGAGLVIDAVMDPVIGSLSDGWRSRFGRRVPFMVAGLVPLVITFNLIFALPAGLGPMAMFAWLTLLSVCLRVSLSIFGLPYQALGAELSDDYAERSSLAAWRWGVGILGTVAVIGLGYGVFLSGPGGVSRRAGYLPLTLTLTVLLVAGALIAIRTGLATRQLQHATDAPSEPLHRRVLGEMGEMVRNRTFRILFLSSLLTQIAQGVNQALGLHTGIFFWKLGTGQLQVLSIAAVLGLVLGAPLAGPLSARFEKRTILIIGLVGLAVCHTVPTALRLMGHLPLEGGALLGFLAAGGFVAGLMLALSLIAFLAIIPDAADEHELLFGSRREGLYFAGWLFATKAATGAGLLFAGVVLQLIDFPAQVSEHGAASAAVPAETAAWLGFAGGPGAALFAVAGVVLALFYRVDRKTHARIIADLAARRAQ